MTHKSDLKKRIRARQAKTGESYTTARMHVLEARDALLNDKTPQAARIIGVVLKCNETSVRLRVPGEDSEVTLKCSGFQARRMAPGQFVDIDVEKRWTWRDYPFASGTVERVWTDVPSLDLEPLALEDLGVDDLRERYQEFEPDDRYYPLWREHTASPGRWWEFDGIAWGAGVGIDPQDNSAGLVNKASEVSSYDPGAAREMLMEALHADLRCIDAHVHLGNLLFERRPQEAIVHYEIAVAIGELSLGENFDGFLPWGCLYNRPFLRALHAYGICRWREGAFEKAEAIFGRILRLNPADNQGARFCLFDVQDGNAWVLEEDPLATIA